MIIIYILIYLVMLLYTKSLNDLISRVVSYVLVSYYMISLILCTLQVNDFFEVAISSQLLFLCGTLFFWFGFISCKMKKRQEYINREYLIDNSKQMVSSIPLFIFMVGFCLFCIPYIPKALAVAQLQGAAEMENKDEIIFGGDNVVTILYNIGVAVASNFAVVSIAISLVTGLWKKYFHYFAACILLQSFDIILSGGRGRVFVVIITLCFVIICFSANQSRVHINKRKFVYLMVLFVLVFQIMTMVTNFRVHGEFKVDKSEKNEMNNALAKTFVNYTVVPVNLFDISMKENYFDRLNGYRYGKATFIGVDYLIQSMVKRLGIDYKTDIYIVQYLQDNRKQCAKGRDYNYAYSMFFFNYMDFGILGVIIIPFLFGYCIRYSIKRFYSMSSIPRLLILVLMFYMMFSSHFSSPFIRPWDMLYLIILVVWDVLYTKKHNKLRYYDKIKLPK